MGRVATIGLDLAKQVFQVHANDRDGNKVFSQRLDRSEMKAFFKKQRRCVVALEASSGAHYWAREIEVLGHTVLMLPPQYVKPFVKRGKTDALDAEAIATAAMHGDITPVRIKTAEEQAVVTSLKTRALFVRERTAAINALRSLLSEFGYVVPTMRVNVDKISSILHSPAAQVPDLARSELVVVFDHIKKLDEHIQRLTLAIKKQVASDRTASRLTTIPGIGAIGAAMIMALVPNPNMFRSSRHFASWLGLTPRTYSSGGIPRLGRISKSGNAALRSQIVLGSFGVILQARKHGHPDAWTRSLVARKPFQVAAVAIANKIARIVWSLLTKGGVYSPSF